MASGDKLIDGLLFDPKDASQGADLFPVYGPMGAQCVLVGNNVNTATTMRFDVELKVAATTEAGVPDFDVEKQYKLTIEEV